MSTSLFSPSLMMRQTIDAKKFRVRPLETGDYDKGFCDALSQLTEVGKYSRDAFLQRFFEMKARGGYYIIVIEDVERRRIVGAGTVMCELKFIRACGTTGHIEDIVVDSSYRGYGLGKEVIVHLEHLGFAVGCYKIILDCSDKNVPFYERCNFVVKERQMVLYRKDYSPPASAKL